MRIGILSLVAGVLMTLAAAAQDREPAPASASLVADSLQIEADNVLVAEGNVEVFYDGARLTASRVSYDRQADALSIDGPIRLFDGDSTLLLADAAELDSALANGILTSARLVLDRQLQLAAAEISRDGARYTRLRRVVASSCEVCENGEAPLWEIRASGVVHDQLERQLYFENAQVRIAGLPVLYVPRLRLPDPTLDRATGFLIPDIRTTSDLGTGLKIPYFIGIGDSADVTLTPYISGSTTTLEARYRQVFGRGAVQLDGAFTFDDDILNGENRAYAFVTGAFRLRQDYRLNFDLEQVTDRSYLLDYDYSDKDRLDSEIAISRTGRDAYTRAGVIRYETLRESDIGNEDTLPEFEAEALHTMRLPAGVIGGDTWLTFDGRLLTRPSNEDILGRDVGRVGVALDWRRDWLLPDGVILDAQAGLALDVYSVDDDSTFESTPQRATPRAALTARWPLERLEPNGARQLLEPIAQFVWTETTGDDVPNEDSILVEFDEGNLFALTRYPGVDRYEQGLRANLGVNWMRASPDGLTLGATVGRVIRFEDQTQFSDGTGLNGDSSDWLAAGFVRYRNELSLINRALFSDSLDFTRNETRLDWFFDRGSLSTSYLWSEAVPDENRNDRLSEWAFEADYDLNRNWEGRADWRYDLVNDRAARAGLGLRYTNECIGVDLSVSRRFTSSIDVSPTTSVNLRVSLNGFGTGSGGGDRRRSCSG